MFIQKITAGEIAACGVSSLPDRPSSPSLYGGTTMTATDLRGAFDRLPQLLAERFNALLASTGLYDDETAAEADSLAALIATELEEGHSLKDLFEEIQNGNFAGRLTADGKRSLWDVIAEIETAVRLPDGFADLRAYIDAPAGAVEEDDPLPISGGAVYETVKDTKEYANSAASEAEQRAKSYAKSYADTPEGRVAQNQHLPVSGDAVYRAIAPLDTRMSAMESAAEGLPFHFETLSATQTHHIVPDGAMPYARIDSVGGYTRKCNNVFAALPGDSYQDESGHMYFTVDVNGRCEVHVDAEIGATPLFPTNFIRTSAQYVSLSIRVVNGSYSESGATGEVYFQLQVGETTKDLLVGETAIFENVAINSIGNFICMGNLDGTLEIMINEGATILPWEPYFEGLKSAKVTAVRSYGKNLYDGPSEFVLNGTYVQETICHPTVEGTTTFSYKRDGERGSQATLFTIYYEDGTLENIGPATYSFVSTKKIKEIALQNWCQSVGRIYDIQLERGEAATEYVPHYVDTYEIPEQILSLSGYGEGIDTQNNNAIDLNAKIYKEHIETIVLNGSESWVAMVATGRPENFFATKIGEKGTYVKEAVLSDTYGATAITSSNNAVGVWLSASTALSGDIISIRPRNTKDHTVDTFKALLASAPVTVKVTRKTAAITDISAYVPDAVYLNVENGGHLEPVNGHGDPAPLSVTYQLMNN